MEPLTAATLKGNWATLLLPINRDNSINYELLSNEIDQLIMAKVDGIYSNGTAGEFHNQTESEYDKINEMLAKKCKAAEMRFQIGASHPSPIISLQRVKRSISLKPDALQVILPDWVPVNDMEQIKFLKEVAKESNGIPLILYNPPHAKTVLKPDEFEKFKKTVPEVIGIKVLSGDQEWVKIMKQKSAHLSIFVPGHLLASGVKNKIASGSYSNVACINPKAAQNWWILMQTNIKAAIELESRILHFFKECIIPYQKRGFSNPALDKFLSAVGGCLKIGTRLRWPYNHIPASEVLPVRKRAKHLIPEFFN